MKKTQSTTPATETAAAVRAIYRYKFATVKPVGTAEEGEGKPPLQINAQAVFMLPNGAEVVDFGFSGTSGPYILAVVNPKATDEEMEPRTFRIVKTGEEFPAAAKYIRSLNLGGPALHLLEVL